MTQPQKQKHHVKRKSNLELSPAESRRVFLDNWFNHASRADKKTILSDQSMYESDQDIKEFLKDLK